MTYNFPRTKFVDDVDEGKQTSKICSEICELLRCEYKEEGDERILEELLDVIHAAETRLRQIEKRRGPGFVYDAKQLLIAKNRARKYYV